MSEKIFVKLMEYLRTDKDFKKAILEFIQARTELQKAEAEYRRSKIK